MIVLPDTTLKTSFLIILCVSTIVTIIYYNSSYLNYVSFSPIKNPIGDKSGWQEITEARDIVNGILRKFLVYSAFFNYYDG